MPTRTWAADRPEDEDAPPPPGRLARLWRPELVFAALIAGFGATYALGVPPNQVPDENAHYFRAYSVSLGRLAPPIMVRGWGGDVIPASAVNVVNAFLHVQGHLERKVTAEQMAALRVPDPPGSAGIPVAFGGAVMYTTGAYLPQAAGIALGRAAGLDPLGQFRAGRLANLALSTLLIALAIRLTPAFKCAFGAAAMIPLSIQQIASISPDSTVIGGVMLLLAAVFRAALPGARPAGRASALAIVGLTAWLALCKFPYAAASLAYLGVPAARMGSRRRYLAVGLLIAAVAAGVVVGSARMSKGKFPDAHPVLGYRASVSKQTKFVVEHKVAFLKACWRTTVTHGRSYVDQMASTLGVDFFHSPLAGQAFLLFLAALMAIDQDGAAALPRGLKPAAATAAAAVLGLMLASQYIWHTKVGAKVVEGIQGRYLIPILPLLPVLLNARSIRVRADPSTLLAIAASGCAAVGVVGVGAFVQRYYVAEPASLLSASNLMAAALGVLALSRLLFGLLHRRDAAADAAAAPRLGSVARGARNG